VGTLRVLHLADVHLDTRFYGKSEEWRARLRDAVRVAFARGVDLAIQRPAHAVLVAGDLFDDDLLTFATEQFLLEQIGRLHQAGIPFFYATGNHDPGRANYRAHALGWPDNVHTFRNAQARREPIVFGGDVVGWITGAGHITKRESANLAVGLESTPSDLPHIALLHTHVVSARGAENHDRYAPATVEDLSAGSFDYWALGHIHTPQQVTQHAWYPGNTQGRNFRETGPKGGLWVEIKKGEPVIPEFVPLAPMVWEAVEAVCPQDAFTLDDLATDLTRQLETTLTAQAAPAGAETIRPLTPGTETLLRVTLTGRTPLARQLRQREELATLAGELAHRLDVSWVDVRPGWMTRPLDLGMLREGPSILATAIELVERARQDDELLATLSPGTLAADVEPDCHLNYLRELLGDLGASLAESLLPEENR